MYNQCKSAKGSISMNTKEVIKIAMAKADVNGVMALVELTGLSYDICNRALRNDGTVKVHHLVSILGSLGYELRAVPI